MKIGYPCINNSVGCTANTTFRLANYSEDNLIKKITANLICLKKILEYNIANDLLFFRISSDLIPFASHPICQFNWQDHFRDEFLEIGKLIRDNNIRISMHPDQFVLINSPKSTVVQNSFADLKWHCEVLDLMNLDNSAKIQIHVGGVYGNKETAIANFICNYLQLSDQIKNRLAIENDDRLYSLSDCLKIHAKTNIPIIFDNFHHTCLNNGESLKESVLNAQKTWQTKDGVLMMDYSSQEPNARRGKHIESIDLKDFSIFLEQTKEIDFDIMLEIKDKEKSAKEALKLLNQLKH